MKKRLGDILVEMGFIDQDQLNMAIMETKKTGILLGEGLLRLDWVTEEQLQMAIAVQSGAKIMDTTTVNIDKSLMATIPREFVVGHEIFPFALEDNILKMATNNPFDVIARDELARLTGYRVEAYIAPKKWVSNAIDLYFQTALTIDDEIEKTSSLPGLKGKIDENSMIRLADLLIEKGQILGASDIHVVPDVHLVRIYYRVDGVLHQQYLFQKSFHQSLITRYKIMANMDISNPNIPHDGRIKHMGKFGEISLRVSSFPTQLGETVVMRLLVYGEVVGDLNRLGFEKEDLQRFKKGIERPYGLILTTGPTGSGKTTTLYSTLMTINNPNINVMTVEDPIEYVIPTIRQTATNPKAGLSFGNALRAAMRQDPDIILVGEIRDKETADLAMAASMTGHLVLSTLHTNDAASAINRLLDLGVNSSILASSLTLVVAQRLLRKICTHCAVKKAPTEEEKALFIEYNLEIPIEVSEPVGCERCNKTGFRGRSGIYEMLEVDKEIEALIFSGAIQSKIEEAAVRSGTTLMFKQALKKVFNQITSIEEVFRVIAHA